MIIRRSVKNKQWAIEREESAARRSGMTGYASIQRISRTRRGVTPGWSIVGITHWPVVPDDEVPDWVWAVIMAEVLG